MPRKYVRSASPMEQAIGFSRGVRCGDFVAIAGTAAIGDNGETIGVGDVEAQTRRCFEVAEAALKDIGASLTDVVRTRIMLVDCSAWKAAAKVHGELFEGISPACTFVGVKEFINPEWLVEIEVDAIVARDSSA